MYMYLSTSHWVKYMYLQVHCTSGSTCTCVQLPCIVSVQYCNVSSTTGGLDWPNHPRVLLTPIPCLSYNSILGTFQFTFFSLLSLFSWLFCTAWGQFQFHHWATIISSLHVSSCILQTHLKLPPSQQTSLAPRYHRLRGGSPHLMAILHPHSTLLLFTHTMWLVLPS